jgi:hypothetical protein
VFEEVLAGNVQEIANDLCLNQEFSEGVTVLTPRLTRASVIGADMKG